jgi:hypothetical protein
MTTAYTAAVGAVEPEASETEATEAAAALRPEDVCEFL